MPRGARLDKQGTLHLVMVWGIEQGSIDRDDSDREEFLRCYLPCHALEAAHVGRPQGRKQLPASEQQGSGLGRPGLCLSRRGSPATALGTRVATSWSGAASGTTKPIPQALHPVKSHSDRNVAAAGVTPTSSLSALRSARSWFPKR